MQLSSPFREAHADAFQAVCAVMFMATLVFMGLSYTKPRPHRVFHYITAAITMVAAIAYFTMGADLGQTGIKPEFMRTNSKVSGNLREIFYVRYIDWYVQSLGILTHCGLQDQGHHYTIVAYGPAPDRWSPMAYHPLYHFD